MFEENQSQNTQPTVPQPAAALPKISNVKPAVPTTMPTMDNRPVPPLSDTSDDSVPQPTEAVDGAPFTEPDSSLKPAPAAGSDGNSGLQDIKKAALQNLAPLMDKLDLAPEEKFRTLMMMIQASDNKDYVQKAFETANGIEDETDRAQALLDIVNEINYLTQPQTTE